jgi:CRP-like cAMP-binding protein
LDEKFLSQLADSSEFVTAKRGEILIRQGSAADCVYVVVRGSLEVFQQGPDVTRPIAILARLSHLEGIFGLRARKFLLLSTSALRKAAKAG